jgi:hypothetical protein
VIGGTGGNTGGDTGDANARTVQPAASALAGYRFTFSGGHEPVDVTTGNSVEVYLADGTYTITATAYKAGGTVGNSGDAAAQGSISVTLAGGAVTGNGGVVPPIILGPISGTGTLEYSITSAAAVGGTMKLWELNGTTPVNGFGTSGVLNIGASPALSAQTYSLAAGRYITEIRLLDGSGNIALLREVVEIWAGLTTALVFAPAVYLDPSAVLAYSGAALSPASTIGGMAIGTGTGTGMDEANAVSYSLAVFDVVNAALSLVPGNDSMFADISWIATTGSAPGNTGYSQTPITDFSSNNILWVKVVSEDAATTRYYKFTLTKSDLLISGDGPYTYAGDVLRITGDGTYSIAMNAGVTTTTTSHIEVASGVSAAITLNGVKIDMSGKVGTAAFDMTDATVQLTLIGTNVLNSGQNRA